MVNALPANLEAEQALLGAMLAGARSDFGLDPEQFFLDKHQVIFRAVRGLEAPDVVTVAADLKRRGELDQAGGESYLHELAGAAVVAGNAPQYAQLVREGSLVREARVIGHELAQLAEWNGHIPEALDRLRTLAERAAPAREFAVLTAKQTCELPDPEVCDELLGPLLRRGDRQVIGAGTGEGKTTLAKEIVRAVVNGEPFLDWQGSGDSRALIIDAEQGLRTSKRRLREAALQEHEAVDYLSVPDGLSLDADPQDIAGLEAVLAKGRYDVVVADPLYKLHRSDSNDERAATDLMRRFDGWRARYGFALILPVHLRKPPPGARFTLAEFFGSSAYTRGAEVVLGLRRLSAGYSQLHFLKDRDGDLPIGERWSLLFERGKGFTRDPNDGKPSAREQLADLLQQQPGLTTPGVRRREWFQREDRQQGTSRAGRQGRQHQAEAVESRPARRAAGSDPEVIRKSGRQIRKSEVTPYKGNPFRPSTSGTDGEVMRKSLPAGSRRVPPDAAAAPVRGRGERLPSRHHRSRCPIEGPRDGTPSWSRPSLAAWSSYCRMRREPWFPSR